MKRLNHKNLIKLHDIFEKTATVIQQQQQQSELPVKTQDNMKDYDQLLAITSTMVNIEKPPKLYIFMDYCMTSLEKLLKTAPDQRLRNWQANHYFKQLVDGLEYLHSLNIIHNDIKPGNLLITCNDTLKICDFSISAELKIFYEHEYLNSKSNENIYNSETDINPQLLQQPTNNNNNNNNKPRFPIIQCTPMFQCPEMLDENIDELLILKDAPKIDIWSAGVTLYQLTTGQLPFQGQTIHQIFENIRSESCEIVMPNFIDKNLSNLLRNMLNREPAKRWCLKQIRDSEWFKKKHPCVREDLANFSEDVIQNEYATFRMINYLEKLCQLKTAAELTSADFNQLYDEMAVPGPHDEYDRNLQGNEAACTPEHDNKKSIEPVHVALPNTSMHNGQATNNKNQTSKQFSHATKVKRSHCSLM